MQTITVSVVLTGLSSEEVQLKEVNNKAKSEVLRHFLIRKSVNENSKKIFFFIVCRLSIGFI